MSEQDILSKLCIPGLQPLSRGPKGLTFGNGASVRPDLMRDQGEQRICFMPGITKEDRALGLSIRIRELYALQLAVPNAYRLSDLAYRSTENSGEPTAKENWTFYLAFYQIKQERPEREC